jgi:hypothetical protein
MTASNKPWGSHCGTLAQVEHQLLLIIDLQIDRRQGGARNLRIEENISGANRFLDGSFAGGDGDCISDSGRGLGSQGPQHPAMTANWRRSK